MQRIKTLTSVIVMLFAAACTTTSGEIKSFKKAGECRKAENLIKEKYSGQTQLYNTAMVYIECDGEKSKGLKTLKTLAAGEFMPAMARLIEFNVASSQMIKRYNTLKSIADERMCVNKVSKAILSREQKISSIARKWTYGGGAKYGSGGIGRASIEADIWADVELSKLAVWKNNEMKRCSLIGEGARASSPNRPPPFYEIGKSQNGSNSTSSETNDKPMTIDNSCIQDGGTRMCYNRQSQRYGISGDSSGISSPYPGVSGQTGISGMSSPYD